jgi:hypothetical protein
VWATGYKADYSWLQIAGVFDGDRIRHHGGGTAVAGLNFVGLPWQTSRGSALLGFVGADAGSLAAPLVTVAPVGTPPPGATARRRHRHPRRALRSALGASRLREPDIADAPMGEGTPPSTVAPQLTRSTAT